MTTEEQSSLDRRVARYAALADPTRLRIVDRLGLGDAAPSELAAQLGLPSNLLAFHLAVLQEAGLVSGHRSEGDRRRRYLRLTDQAWDRPAPAPGPAPDRVLFVCTANTARSQLAQVLWQRACSVPVASAGTHPAARIAARARTVAARHGLQLAPARPRPLSEVLADGDLVVTVCDRAHEELGDLAALHWSVPDPVPSDTDAAFEAAFAELAARVDRATAGLAPPAG